MPIEIDPYLVDVNDGHVPSDRPHLRFWPRRLPRSLTLPETSLWANVEIAAMRYPDKAATLFFGRAKTYAALRADAEAIAGWLQAQGVRRGDRVALFMQNCPQTLIAYHAILRADAVVVPVNTMNKADELAHFLVDSGACAVICSADLAGVVDGANATLKPRQRIACVLATRYADELPPAFDDGDALAPPASQREWLLADPPLPAGVVRWRDALAAGRRHPPGPSHNGPDDLALLAYTSGTTGLPKACMHTHRTLMANVVGASLWGSNSADAVVLGVAPMFHVTGMLYGVIAPMYNASTVVVVPRWDRELAGRLISTHRVTHWACVPTMVIDLFASPAIGSFDLSSLRFVSGGGVAMPRAIAQRLDDEFGLRFCEGYGLTETAAPSHANPPERPKQQCLGMPFFGVDARVVDPDSLRELAVGEIGEIVLRGPMVFRGYWRGDAATAAAFVTVDGRRFLRTGDLGHVDEDGYFFLADRRKRMINASGFKISPSEVELLLYRHPAVQEACVISTRDAYRGETVKAVVVLRAEARGRTRAADIVDWSQGQMAAYKVPRVVEFVDALPKSGAGKVLWRLLQDQENAGAGACLGVRPA